MQKKSIHFKSDFSAILGIEGGWNAPFKARFWAATPSRSFTASWDGASYTNCHLEEDGRLCIAFDNHNIGLGDLMLELTFYLDNQCFADGVCSEVIPAFRPTFTDVNGVEYNVTLSLEGARTLQTIGTLPAYYQKGDTGAQGAQGPQGPQGVKGDKGDKGEKGDTVYLDMTAYTDSRGHLMLVTNDYNNVDATINNEGHLILTL